jgi:hypothetical protein
MLKWSKNINPKKIAATVALGTASLCAAAQSDWHLKKDEDGIKVFTANADNSDFKCIKVECTVKATQSQLVALLTDINRQPDWVYGSKSAEVLKSIKPNEFIFHSQVDVPWPCADRDYIAHITINQTSPQELIIDSHSEPDLIPAKDGIVRVKKSAAHWDVTKVGSDFLKIVYTVSFDPAGSVPAWLTNMFVTKGPFLTFQKLKDKVGTSEYHNAHYDFIKE